jgi:GT2 family glycosyltransferase
MWVRRSAFDRAGGFYESFFLYFEDYDLSLKMGAVGKVMEHRGIEIVHHGGQASRKGLNHLRWFIFGALKFFTRWGWKWLG